MSSRQPGSATPATAIRRQEEERRREEARNTSLQSQVDELRAALRELASRQVRMEEGLKQYEGSAVQNRMLIDQIRQESAQTAQARALDENRTRQLIVDLDQRIDDALRPMRSLQGHVNELIENSRKKTDDTGQHLRRYEELRVQIEHINALVDRAGVMSHQMRDSIDSVKVDAEQLRRDLFRNEDAIKIVDQESRRRVTEVMHVTDGFTTRIDELRSDLVHAFDTIEEVQRSIVHIDPTFAELRAEDTTMKTEINRLQAITTERHDNVLERIDDQRGALAGEINDIRANIDVRFVRLGERLDDAIEQYREFGLRIGAFAMQIEELRQIDASIRRDVWTLHEQRVRLRIEQAQQELDMISGARREAEGPADARPNQRALDT